MEIPPAETVPPIQNKPEFKELTKQQKVALSMIPDVNSPLRKFFTSRIDSLVLQLIGAPIKPEASEIFNRTGYSLIFSQVMNFQGVFRYAIALVTATHQALHFIKVFKQVIGKGHHNIFARFDIILQNMDSPTKWVNTKVLVTMIQKIYIFLAYFCVITPLKIQISIVKHLNAKIIQSEDQNKIQMHLRILEELQTNLQHIQHLNNTESHPKNTALRHERQIKNKQYLDPSVKARTITLNADHSITNKHLRRTQDSLRILPPSKDDILLRPTSLIFASLVKFKRGVARLETGTIIQTEQNIHVWVRNICIDSLGERVRLKNLGCLVPRITSEGKILYVALLSEKNFGKHITRLTMKQLAHPKLISYREVRDRKILNPDTIFYTVRSMGGGWKFKQPQISSISKPKKNPFKEGTTEVFESLVSPAPGEIKKEIKFNNKLDNSLQGENLSL